MPSLLPFSECELKLIAASIGTMWGMLGGSLLPPAALLPLRERGYMGSPFAVIRGVVAYGSGDAHLTIVV